MSIVDFSHSQEKRKEGLRGNAIILSTPLQNCIIYSTKEKNETLTFAFYSA